MILFYVNKQVEAETDGFTTLRDEECELKIEKQTEE